MKLQAYQPEWAFYTALRDRAARWQRQELLSPAQLAGIEAAYPLGYYRPAWPLRVGLFIFTWFGLAVLGLGPVALSDGSPLLAGLMAAAAYLTGLELLIRNQRFYHCGSDNALLYAGLGSAVFVIFYIAYKLIWNDNSSSSITNPYLPVPLVLVLALFVAAVLRYADALVTAAAVVVVLLLLANIGQRTALGTALLPFLAMGTAAGMLVLYRSLTRRLAGAHLADYYATCLLTLKVLSLVTLYLGGNYLIVREGSAMLHDLPDSVQVPFAPLFYGFTAGIPLLYLVLGLRRADRPTLLVGLLALAFSLFTVRYYRSLMPPEVTATLAGTLLTLLAGTLLRTLRPARWGLTSLLDDEPRFFNLENLIQTQTAHAPGAPEGGGFEFGGGQSGGGGATGTF